MRQMHIGTTQELIPNDATITVSKLQVAKDYGAYMINHNTRKIKRYYKPA